jgi:hypothetical protein
MHGLSLRARALGAAILTVAGVAACLALASLQPGDASGYNPKEISVDRMRDGKIDGLIVARRAANRRVRLDLSLHGLTLRGGKPTKYVVLASTQPCSKPGFVDGADYVTWRTQIIMANTEGDWFVSKRARRRLSLASTRSVRVYEREQDAELRERACRVKWELSELDAAKPFRRMSLAVVGQRRFRGIIAAGQRAGRRRVKVYASVHGLEPRTRYTLVGSRQPCSKAAAIDAADLVVWRTGIIMANTEGDFHVKAARLRGPLRSIRSVRIYSPGGGQRGGKSSPKLLS